MAPTPFEAHLDPKKARGQMVFGAVGAMGALFFLYKARTAEVAVKVESLVPAIIGLGVFCVFAGLVFKALKTLRNPNKNAVLRIHESGILDTRKSQTPIAWSTITNAELFDMRNTTRSRELRNKDNNTPPIWAVRLQVKSSAGNDEIIISAAELNTDGEAIFKAITAYLDP